MTPLHPHCTADSFEARYQRDPDPWAFATSPYERQRYRTILQALRRPARGLRYQNAYEPGCSIGELTALLAPLCRRLRASDISPTAVARAQLRCAPFRNVEIRCQDLAQSVPSAPVDLIVFSEIGYYFSSCTLVRIVRRIARQLSPHGEWVAAHWLGHSSDHVLRAATVHALLRATLPLRWVSGAVHRGFRIDSWIRG